MRDQAYLNDTLKPTVYFGNPAHRLDCITLIRLLVRELGVNAEIAVNVDGGLLVACISFVTFALHLLIELSPRHVPTVDRVFALERVSCVVLSHFIHDKLKV